MRKRPLSSRGFITRWIGLRVFGPTLVCCLLGANLVLGESNCGNPFVNGVGPYDYNDQEAREDRAKIPMVEAYHFTAKVERLESGESQSDPAGDLDYTLRAVPNHHRALYAISRYELIHGVSKWRTAACYFERALAFRPNDPVVRLLFGLHFAIRDEHRAAVREYRQAESLMPGNAELQYNLGLSLFELGDYRAARESAEHAYKSGYPLPGLKKKLEAAGYGWNSE